MSIFTIIILCAAAWLLIVALTVLICILFDVDPEVYCLPTLIPTVIGFIISIFIAIGASTEDARAYVASYNAQKITIEQSINNDSLDGLERIELVKQATQLNGNLARKKELFGRWHVVAYDKYIYDDVEFISLEKE